MPKLENHLSFIRFDKWEKIDAAAGATFKTNNAVTTEEAEVAIRRAVTQWVKETDDGRRVYAYANDDLNIGDLASHGIDTLKPFLEAEGIFDFTITDLVKPGDHLPYDRVLVNCVED